MPLIVSLGEEAIGAIFKSFAPLSIKGFNQSAISLGDPTGEYFSKNEKEVP